MERQVRQFPGLCGAYKLVEIAAASAARDL